MNHANSKQTINIPNKELRINIMDESNCGNCFGTEYP